MGTSSSVAYFFTVESKMNLNALARVMVSWKGRMTFYLWRTPDEKLAGNVQWRDEGWTVSSSPLEVLCAVDRRTRDISRVSQGPAQYLISLSKLAIQYSSVV